MHGYAEKLQYKTFIIKVKTTLVFHNWELRIKTQETFGASLWLYLKTQLLWMVILLISSGTGFEFTGNTFGEGENRI